MIRDHKNLHDVQKINFPLSINLFLDFEPLRHICDGRISVKVKTLFDASDYLVLFLESSYLHV